MTSSSAISRFVRPLARRARTSSSRGVSPSASPVAPLPSWGRRARGRVVRVRRVARAPAAGAALRSALPRHTRSSVRLTRRCGVRRRRRAPRPAASYSRPPAADARAGPTRQQPSTTPRVAPAPARAAQSASRVLEVGDQPSAAALLELHVALDRAAGDTARRLGRDRRRRAVADDSDPHQGRVGVARGLGG